MPERPQMHNFLVFLALLRHISDEKKSSVPLAICFQGQGGGHCGEEGQEGEEEGGSVAQQTDKKMHIFSAKNKCLVRDVRKGTVVQNTKMAKYTVPQNENGQRKNTTTPQHKKVGS